MDNLQLGIRITADSSGASATLTSLDGNLKSLGRTATQSAGSMDSAFSATRKGLASISQQLEQVKVGFYAFTAAKGLIDMSKGVVDLAAQFDRMNTMMTAASGGMALSASNMAFARKVSSDLGLDLVTTASAFAKLTAASRGTAIQGDQVRYIFESVSKASAALGLSGDEASGALLAISQMMSKGKVSAEELRGQLGERLPGAFNLMAQALGVSTSKLDDMLQKGDVMATDALPKFAKALDEAYSGARFDGITNNVNRLNNAWKTFLDNITPTDTIKSGLNLLSKSFNGWNSILGDKSLDERINAEIKAISELSNSPQRSQYLYRQEVEKSIEGHQKLLDLLIAQKKIQDAQAESERSKTSGRSAGAPSPDEVQQMVAAAAKKYGVSEAFALAIAKAESDFIQSRVSTKGAIGVGQLMPATAKRFGVDANDLQQNIDGMMRYLKFLTAKFNNDLRLAAAGYNAGEGSVDKAGKQVPNFPETRAYVDKVSKIYDEFLAKYPGGLPFSDSQSQRQETEAVYQRFKALTEKMTADAENEYKLKSAHHKTEIDQIEMQRKAVAQSTQEQIAGTTVFSEKMALAEAGRRQQIALIEQESEIRRQQFSEEERTLMVRLDAVRQQIDGQSQFNRSIQETAQLQQEASGIETGLKVLSEQRAQAEIDVQEKINEVAKQGISLKEQQAQQEQAVREEALRSLEVMSSNLEYAREMASGLSDAFGSVGTAIGSVMVSLGEYAKQQETIRIQAEEAIKKNPAKQYEIQQDAALKQSRNQIKTYGDLTQAAQGFFKKGTKGYESLGAAVKVFRAFEMAQSVMSTVKQMEQMGGLFSSFTEMLTQMGIISSANTQKELTEAELKAQAKALEGAANQGSSGDPYSAFARVAAWIALMAGLGIAVGGGGGSSPAAKPIDTTGMGTVKGDPTAISQSISESLQILVDNSSNDLNYSAGMLQALLDIKTALGGVADLVATDLTPLLTSLSAQFGADNIKQAGFLFDSQRFSKVYDSGLLKGSIGARIESSTDILGMSIKKGQTLLQEYGKKYQEAFGQVIRSIADGIMAIGETIGLTDQEIKDRLKNFRINLGTIDIAGLSAEEAAKKIEAAFSAMSDTMAKKALPEFKDFQQVGEGYFETITRVAEGINRATGGLELLGMEAINYADIINKQGDVAAEITRQTLMAQGDLSEGTRKYVEQLTGSAEDIVDAYKQIIAIENLMRASGLGIEDLDRTTINAAGGLDALTSALEAFYDNYLNDDQKVTAKTNELTAAFARLGYALPQSKEEFYRLVSGIDRSTDAGKKLFAQMIGLSQGFSDLQDAIRDQAQAAQEAADALVRQQEELKQAEVNRLKDIQKQQDDLAAQAQKNYDSAATALSKAFDDLLKVQQRFETISQNIQAYYAELTGSRSPIGSPEQRYRLAQAELGRVRALAIGGDETALNQLVGVSKEFLDASREYNASSEAYQRDYQDVLKTLEDGQSYAESQVNLAQEQVNFAKASYSQLVKVDASVLSITGAVGNLTNAMSNFAQASIANSVAAANAAAAAAQVAAAAASQVANASSSASSSAASTIINNKPPAVMTPPRTVASPATGYIPTKSVYRWGYDHAAGMARFYYQQLLGRDPENEQVVAGIANQLANAYMSEWDIVQSFRNSAEYRDLVSKGFVPGFAKGGLTGTGFAVVGEHGPELIDFKSPARVYTASETEGLLSGAGSSQKLEHLTDAVSAGIRVDQAGYRALAELLTSIDERLSSVESANKLAGAAV